MIRLTFLLFPTGNCIFRHIYLFAKRLLRITVVFSDFGKSFSDH